MAIQVAEVRSLLALLVQKYKVEGGDRAVRYLCLTLQLSCNLLRREAASREYDANGSDDAAAPQTGSSSGVSMCTFVLAKQVCTYLKESAGATSV